MFRPFCTACFSLRQPTPVAGAPGLYLCDLCRDELSELNLAGRPKPLAHLAVLSLYRYEGLVRKLVLRVKVKGDQRALQLLLALALARREGEREAGWADAVVVCPSSLWGRLRGRLDLAAHLGSALARLGDTPLQPAPWHLHWRLKKQALLAQRDRDRPLRRSQPASASTKPLRAWLVRQSLTQWTERAARLGFGSRILLVDDILTTGGTLLRVAGALGRPGEREVRCLTLAAAGRKR